MKPRVPLAGGRAPDVYTNPFAPRVLEIHPLSRIDKDAQGRPLIVCHLELRDEWGDPCKATGALEVQLYRPVGARQGGLGVQELKWDVNLSNLEMQRLYDPSTRTYRLELEGAPAWVLGEGSPRGEVIARLRAVLETSGPQGERRTLTSEYAVGG